MTSIPEPPGDPIFDDWKAELGPDGYVGRAEVESGWPEGYDRMTEVDAGRVRK